MASQKFIGCPNLSDEQTKSIIYKDPCSVDKGYSLGHSDRLADNSGNTFWHREIQGFTQK